jgi:hypothetical protein
MEKEFVPYEPSLALKELGFDEPCLGVYYESKTFYIYTKSKGVKNSDKTSQSWVFTAPTYSQAFRWFREKYGYYYPIHRTTNNTNQVLYSIGPYAGDYFTYEEAELACLIKLIEIVKNK